MGKSINSWEATPQVPKVSGANEVTRIPFGAEVRNGILVSKDDIRIDGRFFGKIVTKGKIVLGEKAVFKGDIVCDNADIYGMMEGNIVVGDVLSLMNTCYYKGLIQITKLGVENGAKLDGSCKIICKEEFDKLSAEFAANLNKEAPVTEIDIEKKSNASFVKPAVPEQNK